MRTFSDGSPLSRHPCRAELHVAVSAQQAPIGYDDTPMQPNGKWRVHDGTRPYPRW